MILKNLMFNIIRRGIRKCYLLPSMTNTFKELEFDDNSNKPQKKMNHINNKHVYKTFIKHV